MQVRFASYNVAKFEHPEAVAATVREVDADVLALQEVPSPESLDGIAEGYPHRAFYPTNDPRGHHMAVLSRRPLDGTEVHRGAEFVRGVGETTVQLGPFPCKVFTTHLKADPFYGKPFTSEDAARARARRAVEFASMQALLPSARYVVAGDLNAAPQEVAGLLEGGVLSDPLAASAQVSHPVTGVRRDYLLTSPGVSVVSSHVHDSATARQASDHLPVVLTLELPDC